MVAHIRCVADQRVLRIMQHLDAGEFTLGANRSIQEVIQSADGHETKTLAQITNMDLQNWLLGGDIEHY